MRSEPDHIARETLKQLREVVGARAPADAEIKFARDSLVLQLPGSNETSDEVAGSYADILTYGLKDTCWNDYVGEVNAITAQKLTVAAQKLIHPKALTRVVVEEISRARSADSQTESRRGAGARHRRQGRALTLPSICYRARPYAIAYG